MENIPSNLKWTKGLLLGVLIIVSVLISLFGILLIGSYIGEMLNPVTIHACACDEPPILSVHQAFILGITYLIILMIGMHYALRLLDVTKNKRRVLLLVLFILNGAFCLCALEILSTEISG